MDRINYEGILINYPWIVEKGIKCVLSTDSDGFLCGLAMSNLLDWKIAGFYDNKVLVHAKGIDPEELVFLDVDINRPQIRSVGHHIVLYNKRQLDAAHKDRITNFNYNSCIQPNIIRGFDGKTDWQRKYPFATIHLLLGILQVGGIIDELNDHSIWPLLFTDGVANNLLGYPENCLEWMEYLRIVEKGHILNDFFCGDDYSFYKIMRGMDEFFRIRDGFNQKTVYRNGEIVEKYGRRSGDKLKSSSPKGEILNLYEKDHSYYVHEKEKERIEGFITVLARYCDWNYNPLLWSWGGYDLKVFNKADIIGAGGRLNNKTYKSLMEMNPFSLAMTSSQNIEYTLAP